jgi:hypothetical protein
MPTIEQVVCGPAVTGGIECCYNALYTPAYACM